MAFGYISGRKVYKEEHIFLYTQPLVITNSFEPKNAKIYFNKILSFFLTLSSSFFQVHFCVHCPYACLHFARCERSILSW